MDGRVYAVDLEGDGPQTRRGWALANGEEGAISAAPCVGPERVYAATERGVILALDRHTGAVRWRYAAEGRPAFRTAPVLHRGVLYAVAEDGMLYAFDENAPQEPGAPAPPVPGG